MVVVVSGYVESKITDLGGKLDVEPLTIWTNMASSCLVFTGGTNSCDVAHGFPCKFKPKQRHLNTVV